jgi:CheY-like chemotaxis protein
LTLQSWGCRAETAPGGEEALRQLGHAAKGDDPFDLVLLDARMPEMDGTQVEYRLRQEPGFGNPSVVFLSSVGHRLQIQDDVASRQVSCLTKPVKRSVLMATLASALRGSPDGGGAAPESRSETCRSDRRRYKSRVLLAEDNAVNRRVASAILARLGHDVTEAENGALAIKLLEEKPFDVVFMDVQMPEMDGLEATKRIRENPSWVDLPIIALTAHAMKSDRERCLEGGMSDYISKPLRAADFERIVEKWIGHRPSRYAAIDADETAATSPELRPTTQKPIDISRAVSRMGDSREFFEEVVHVFLGHVPTLLAEAHAACASNDARRLEAVAHTLMGSAANVCAEPTRALAEQLEKLARNGEFEAAHALLLDLDEHLGKLRDFMLGAQTKEEV